MQVRFADQNPEITIQFDHSAGDTAGMSKQRIKPESTQDIRLYPISFEIGDRIELL